MEVKGPEVPGGAPGIGGPGLGCLEAELTSDNWQETMERCESHSPCWWTPNKLGFPQSCRFGAWEMENRDYSADTKSGFVLARSPTHLPISLPLTLCCWSTGGVGGNLSRRPVP